ncbi:MAG: gamma-glutamyltransferase [Dehalococcoidia bacterium]
MKYNNYPSSTRPTAMGFNGMAASAHPFATSAGINILKKGGNAFDAIVAIASTLNVVEPFMSGMGGVGVALVYNAKKNKLKALNFSGSAPKLADAEKYTLEAKSIGPWAPLVPGNVAGWLEIQENLGVLDREEVFKDAISYAKNGFPMTHFHYTMFGKSVPRLNKFPSAEIILNNGKVSPPGTKIVMPDLAKSLELVAKNGADEFYRGSISKKIIESMKMYGGLISEDDLNSVKAEWSDPLTVKYKNFEVSTVPPNSSGFQILETLKILETLPNEKIKFQDPDFVHRFIETVKLAATDRIAYGGDQALGITPTDKLLSNEYANYQSSRISTDKTNLLAGEVFNPDAPQGALTPVDLDAYDGGMTTHFSVSDRDGNVVSITQTLGGGFGSALAPEGTGIFLNNMGDWFDLHNGSRNQIGPNRKQDMCLSPTQTFKDGEFFASVGTPGSWGILQTTSQMLINLLDFEMNMQQVIDSPRFKAIGGNRVEMEARFPDSLLDNLKQRGHDIVSLPDWSTSVGGGHGIKLDKETGSYQGGADPRRDGYAFGI